MDFFGHQDAARKKTKQLVVLYVLSVILIVATICLAITTLFVSAELSREREMGHAARFSFDLLWRPDIIVPAALLLLLIIALGTFWKLFLLRGGGKVVAESLGGHLLHPNTVDPQERKLLNVVEEMALASGVSVPPVYLMSEEEGINAFAAGFTPNDAVIGVTRGCMTLLSRDELQGVIAHEFSHILNGDMRLNLRLIGILNGILCIAITGYFLIRFTSRTYGRRYSNRKGGDPRAAIFLLGCILYALGYIGVFFGKLIKSAVSRQREFLADASAVQFTRDPAGISGALKKIGGYVWHSRIQSSHAEEASHLFFANGVRSALLGLFSTHPPLGDRINRLDPSFKGVFDEVHPIPASEESAAGISQLAGAQQPLQSSAAYDLQPESVKSSIGNPSAAHLQYSRQLLRELPEELLAAAHEPYGAGSLVFALLLDESREVRDRQLSMISRETAAHILQQVLRFERFVDALPSHARLPLLDLCKPALKELSASQFEDFQKCVRALIVEDKKLSLFEYALAHSILSSLEWAFTSGAVEKECRSLSSAQDSLAMVLSALAWLDTRDHGRAKAAFDAGREKLGIELSMAERGSSNLQQLHACLTQLAGAKPRVREKIIDACLACALYDERVSATEAELLRAISSSLNCPIPPFLPSASAAA